MIRLSPDATLFHADCREALRGLPSDSLDSCCTDPPYNLNFMGKAWDTSEVAMDAVFWAEVYRVLKPGAFVAAFGASRQYHRMACAIEDAGFEIRDSLMWVYGTGFPKSHDVSKGIDKMFGAEREIVSQGALQKRMIPGADQNKDGWIKDDGREFVPTVTKAATPAAKEWEGWGTALKPAFEPIVLARKPLSEPTVAANVLRWRTGALNIGASRVGNEARVNAPAGNKAGGNSYNMSLVGMPDDAEGRAALGRWPANVVHSGEAEVIAAFPHTSSGVPTAGDRNGEVYGKFGKRSLTNHGASTGSAARFFKSCPPDETERSFHYSAKASKADRAGSRHPTVKPIALMEWLATLITPPGGTVLDPFAGSGTTGIAATRRGFRVVLCEREVEYVADIKARFDGSVRDTPTAPGRRIYGTFADKSGQDGTVARRLDRPQRPIIDLATFRREAALLEEVRALQSRLRRGRVAL
jgi:site-specific DNA-methyltransferase (adenine-specific)